MVVDLAMRPRLLPYLFCMIRGITQLAKMTMDPKIVFFAADVVGISMFSTCV